MAQRRMFSRDIVRSDAFLDMPVSSQLLYFQMGMEADDDGFLAGSKMVMRLAGANDDDMKILLTKRFLIQFPDGIMVIKHWKINNYIQNDRYKETRYVEHKNTLFIKSNGAYTENALNATQNTPRIQNGYKMETQVRLGKVSKDKKDTAAVAAPDSSKPEENRKLTREQELLQWAADRRGTKFVNYAKQFKAIALLKKAGKNREEIKARWCDMERDDFWSKKGFDFTNVANSFDKKT